MDCLDRHGDAGRIGQRQIALRRHRLCRDNLDLAWSPARVEIQRFLVGDFLPFGTANRCVSHESVSAFCFACATLAARIAMSQAQEARGSGQETLSSCRSLA